MDLSPQFWDQQIPNKVSWTGNGVGFLCEGGEQRQADGRRGWRRRKEKGEKKKRSGGVV